MHLGWKDTSMAEHGVLLYSQLQLIDGASAMEVYSINGDSEG